MICAFASIYGIYSFTQLAIDAYPDIADTSSQVVTQAPGLAAEEVEQQITIPLERELNGTPGLLLMRSKSTFGLSLITIVFREGIENYWSRQRITERIQNVTLPPNLTPGLDPVTSPTGQIYYYTLESDTKGQRELSEIQRWIVIPGLKQVPGVADVSNFGGITTQFQLELDAEQLVRFNLSLNARSAMSPKLLMQLASPCHCFASGLGAPLPKAADSAPSGSLIRACARFVKAYAARDPPYGFE
jgi:cobalt-zinc-cadmium resistance protein CzcA